MHLGIAFSTETLRIGFRALTDTDFEQLAGSKKKEGDEGLASSLGNFSGLRPAYW